jgi:hypothetical protein
MTMTTWRDPHEGQSGKRGMISSLPRGRLDIDSPVTNDGWGRLPCRSGTRWVSFFPGSLASNVVISANRSMTVAPVDAVVQPTPPATFLSNPG